MNRLQLTLSSQTETNNQMAMEEDDGESFQNIAVEFAMNFPRADFITTADKIAGKAGPDGDGEAPRMPWTHALVF